MSTTKGRVYENYIKEKCWSWGLKASRKVLSGGNLKRPYDVLISGKVHVEAKRRLKKAAITIEGEWLENVGKNDVVVFTAGKSPGKELKLRAICLYNDVIKEAKGGYDKPLMKIEVKKYKTVNAEVFDKNEIMFTHGSKEYLVVLLYDYLVAYGYIMNHVNNSNQSVHLIGPDDAVLGDLIPGSSMLLGRDVKTEYIKTVEGVKDGQNTN